MRSAVRTALPALIVAIAVSGCGRTSGTNTASGGVGTSAASPYAGARANPPYEAPPIRLRNYDGRPVALNSLRGKAVLVTFIYTHCPDVCPLIVGNLHTARKELGAGAKKLQIVAVSADPRGDTAKTVRSFLHSHQMLGRMDYLIGSARQLRPAWKRWGILAKADPKNPDAVEHSALIYGISAKGKVTTLYSANFQPREIVHDVPRLAAN